MRDEIQVIVGLLISVANMTFSELSHVVSMESHADQCPAIHQRKVNQLNTEFIRR